MIDLMEMISELLLSFIWCCIEGLVQEKRNSIAKELYFRLSCTNHQYDVSHTALKVVVYDDGHGMKTFPALSDNGIAFIVSEPIWNKIDLIWSYYWFFVRGIHWFSVDNNLKGH